MKINAVSVRPGMILEHQNKLWRVAKIQHTQPGKGGAYMQVEMKDIKSGTKLNERFRSSETLEQASLEQKDFQYLYTEGDSITAMDLNTYEQISLNLEIFGDQAVFLQDGLTITVEFHETNPVGVELPEMVTLEVVEADPVIKGQTATSNDKPAKLSNGLRVMVPTFIASGDRVVVRTADATYVERAKA